MIDEDAATEADDTDSGASEVEAQAREQGWVPKSEYRGKAPWTNAGEFIKRGDPRYLRKALDQTQREIDDLKQARKADQAQFADRLDRFEAMSKAQRAKLYGDIETARRSAVEAGDTAEYDRLNRVEANLYEQEQAVPTKPAAQAEQQNPDQTVLDWIEENPWFETDKDLNFAAATISKRIADRHPTMSVEDQLAKVKDEVVKRFPEKFGKAEKTEPRRNGVTAVESGSRSAAPSRGQGYADIPADERKYIDRHIEEGLYYEAGEKPDLAKAKARAAKAYWS